MLAPYRSDAERVAYTWWMRSDRRRLPPFLRRTARDAPTVPHWKDGRVGQSATVVVLYGPKAAGKSWAAGVLQSAGVHHVDADEVVLDLLARGVSPDPELGWLTEVEAAVRTALDRYPLVSVEATGAWDSDWMLADQFTASGVRVLTVWVTAPLEVTLDRLSRRTTRRVATSPAEARRIHAEATRRAATRRFDATIDTSGVEDAGKLSDLVGRLS